MFWHLITRYLLSLLLQGFVSVDAAGPVAKPIGNPSLPTLQTPWFPPDSPER